MLGSSSLACTALGSGLQHRCGPVAHLLDLALAVPSHEHCRLLKQGGGRLAKQRTALTVHFSEVFSFRTHPRTSESRSDYIISSGFRLLMPLRSRGVSILHSLGSEGRIVFYPFSALMRQRSEICFEKFTSWDGGAIALNPGGLRAELCQHKTKLIDPTAVWKLFGER